jgi:hypothetical protein
MLYILRVLLAMLEALPVVLLCFAAWWGLMMLWEKFLQEISKK